MLPAIDLFRYSARFRANQTKTCVVKIDYIAVQTNEFIKILKCR